MLPHAHVDCYAIGLRPTVYPETGRHRVRDIPVSPYRGALPPESSPLPKLPPLDVSFRLEFARDAWYGSIQSAWKRRCPKSSQDQVEAISCNGSTYSSYFPQYN